MEFQTAKLEVRSGNAEDDDLSAQVILGDCTSTDASRVSMTGSQHYRLFPADVANCE